MPSKTKRCYVEIEAHRQKLDEIKRYFGGDYKTIIRNVIDKYLPQYCEEMRAYHLSGSETLPTGTVKPEAPVEDDFSSDLADMFNP